MSINKVVVSGNLTREPELRRTAGGTAVLTMPVAVNDRRKNPQTGEWEDFANYVDCALFGRRAEALADILSKGAKVCVEGKLRYSSWEKDGQRRSKLDVLAEEVELMQARPSGGRAQGPGDAYGAAYGSGAAYDEDIPF